MFHYDGVRLEKIPTALTDGPREDGKATSNHVTSVVAFSKQDVWLGSGSEMAHFDGANWTILDVPAAKLWGRSSSDLWAISDYSYPDYRYVVSHFDGTSWTKHSPPSDFPLLPLSYADEGSSIGGCDNYFWISRRNQLSVFDGSTWTASYLDGPFDAAVWGQSPDALIAGGLRAGIMRNGPLP